MAGIASSFSAHITAMASAWPLILNPNRLMPSAISAVGEPACASSSSVLSATGCSPNPVRRQRNPKPSASMIGLRAISRTARRTRSGALSEDFRSAHAICSVPQSQSSGVLTDRISAIEPAA